MHKIEADPSTEIVTSWIPLIAVSIGIFLVATDQVMLPVGAPAIAEDLNTTVGGIQTVIAVVSLVAAPLYIAGGKLGERYGKKAIFLVGMALYAAGSFVGALAPDIGVLTFGWSVVRAIGMVTSIPAGVGILIATYEGGERARAFAVYGVAGVLAALVAPMLMGFSAQELTWRVPLFTVAGLALVAFLLSLGMRETERDERLVIDWPGTAVFGISIASLILAGLLGTRYGWWEARRPFMIGDVAINPFGLSPSPWLFLFGLVVAAGAVAWFASKARRGGSPLFDPGLFANSVFAASFVMAALLFSLMGAIPFTVPVFLQGGVGFDPTTAGLVMVSFSVGSMILGFLSGRLLERLSPRSLMQVAIVVVALGLGWLAFAVGPDVDFWEVAAPMFVLGTGFGVITSQAPNIQMSSLESHQVGEGSGMAEVGKELGIGLGTAVVGGILLSSALGFTVDGVMRDANVEITAQERQTVILEIEDLGGIGAIEDVDIPEEVKQAVRTQVPEAYSDGMRLAIGVMFMLALAGFVAASLIPKFESDDIKDDELRESVADVTARRA